MIVTEKIQECEEWKEREKVTETERDLTRGKRVRQRPPARRKRSNNKIKRKHIAWEEI